MKILYLHEEDIGTYIITGEPITNYTIISRLLINRSPSLDSDCLHLLTQSNKF